MAWLGNLIIKDYLKASILIVIEPLQKNSRRREILAISYLRVYICMYVCMYVRLYLYVLCICMDDCASLEACA